MINVTSLASFRRFLAMPGATLQVIQHDWSDPKKTTHPLTPKPEFWEPKQVAKLQSNGVQFTTGSWLRFPKAAHMSFRGTTVACCLNQDGSFTHQLMYALTIDPRPVETCPSCGVTALVHLPCPTGCGSEAVILKGSEAGS